MARRSKVIFGLLLAFLYVVVNVCPLRAEALPDVMSGSTTLADNIMTYYALSGSAVANSDWINTLYSSYGSSFGTIEELAQQGYLVLNDSGFWEPVQELGQMIEQAPAYSSLGLNEMFNVSAEEAAAGGGFAAASGGSILAGSLGGVASTGVVPLLGGVTAAYWGGIAIGTLINHAIEHYGRSIYGGTPINLTDYSSNLPSGYTFSTYLLKSNNDRIAYSYNGRAFFMRYRRGTADDGIAVCFKGNSTSFSESNLTLGTSTTRSMTPINGYTMYTTLGGVKPNTATPIIYEGDYSAIQTFIQNLQNGTQQFPKIYSPDMIGENGNLEGNDENGNITVPDMKPQIDPGTQAGKPLSLQDWQNFANAVQNNNNQTSPTGSPDNASLFDNILDLIRTVIPENVPNPNPNPNPDPWSPPVVTPVPDPSYPDPVPDQQITENPQESENPQQTENPIDTGKPWRLPDLRNKFPFCIPWDIAKVFSKLKVNARQAPHISWRFNPPNTPLDYTFNLDLEDFEDAAALLRTLELLGFIVGLGFATRYLIGAN